MNRLLVVYFLTNITNIFSQSTYDENQGMREFEIDCSIRALEVENDSTCWFAGSKNKFGYTNDFGNTWKENVIKYDSFDLEFRSISVTTNSVFILSVGSPALLFKIDKQYWPILKACLNYMEYLYPHELKDTESDKNIEEMLKQL